MYSKLFCATNYAIIFSNRTSEGGIGMLLCSARIPVVKEFTAPTFVALAIEWIEGSRNYCFDAFTWDGSAEFTRTGKNEELFQVGHFEDQKICAVHFRATDNRSISWTTDFILDYENGILAFQLYRDAPENIDYVHRAFSLPFLVRKIISAGYAASDKGLPVTSEPILIHEEDSEGIAQMMLRKIVYDMPIVYISCETDGHCLINPYMVAEKLNGVAHVIFETSRAVSLDLRDKTDGTNPYRGAIEIYYPNGNRRFLPSQLTGTHSNKVYTIVNAVFEHLNQVRVEDRFSWSQLQVSKLRKQLSTTIQKKQQDSETYATLADTYEDMLAEKDSQIKRLSEQLLSANNTITQLEAQLGNVERIPVLAIGEEQDLYPFEQQSLLIEILEKEVRDAAPNSRKEHILRSLMEANKCENAIAEKRNRIKTCLHGYKKMTSTISRELQSIGFSLSDDGKHIKLVFGEDSRYTGTLSKTGSDHRAGDNTAHDLIRSIF